MQVTRAFIVRPFGAQEGIDFDRVERDLIAPALKLRDRGPHDRRDHAAGQYPRGHVPACWSSPIW